MKGRLLFLLVVGVFALTPQASSDDLAGLPLGPENGGSPRPESAREDQLDRGLVPLRESSNPTESPDHSAAELMFAPDSRHSSSAQLPPEAFAERRRFAVVIGIDKYPEGSAYGRLRYAGSDAVGMADAFLRLAGFHQVLLLTDAAVPESLKADQGDRLSVVHDVSYRSLSDHVDMFVRRANRFDDVLVFYFAGHGDHGGRSSFLVPGDYLDANNSRPLYLSQVLEWMVNEPVRARNKLVVLDACRSAPNSSDGRVMAQAFRNDLVKPGERMTIITGCDADESSQEDAELGHGRFTWAMLDGLSGNGFPAGEEYLLVSHLYEHVLETFQKRRWGRQVPQQFHAGSVFSLAHRALPKPPPLDDFEWTLLRETHEKATKLLRANQLEQASSAYRFALRATGSAITDAAVSRMHGRLLLERAVVLHRLGQMEESRSLRQEAAPLVSDSPVQLALEGYDLAREGKAVEALAKLEAAIAQTGERSEIDAYLWSRKAALEKSIDDYAAAAMSFGAAAMAAHRAGNRSEVELYYDQMNSLDFDKAWLEQSRLADAPQFGVQVAAAEYACAREIFGEGDWRTASARVKHEALQQQAALPAAQRRALQELETLYLRFSDVGNDRAALSVAQLLHDLETAVHGDDHPWHANSLSCVASRLRNLSRYDEAATAYRRTVEIYRRGYGEANPSTLNGLLRLAAALRSGGRDEEAAQCLSQARPGVEMLLQEVGDASSADARWWVGSLLYNLRDYERAAPHFEAAAAAYVSRGDVIDAGWMQGWWGGCYRELKLDDKAVPIYQQAAATFRAEHHLNGLAVQCDNLGKALFRLNRFDESLTAFAEAADAYAQAGNDADSAWMHDWRGDALRKLKRHEEAIGEFDQALAVFQRRQRTADMAHVSYARANAFFDLRRNAEARELFAESRRLNEAADRPITAAWCLASEGACLRRLDREGEAIPLFQESLARFAQIKQTEDISGIHALLARSLAGRGRHLEAIPVYRASIEANTAVGQPVRAAADQVMLGLSCRKANADQEADAAYQAAIALFAAQPELSPVDLTNWGNAYFGMKRYEEAAEQYLAAAEKYAAADSPIDAAKMEFQRGGCLDELKRYDEAIAVYRESMRRLAELGLQESFAYEQRELAKCYYHARRYEEAIPEFERAAAAYAQDKRPIDAAWMYDWIGDCWRDQGNQETALRLYQENLVRFQEAKDDDGVSYVANKVATALVNAGKAEEAIPLFLTAAEAYERLGNKDKAARQHLDRGRALENLNRPEEALGVFDAALVKYQETHQFVEQAFLQVYRGQCLHHLGRRDEAIVALGDAIRRFGEVEHQKDLSSLYRDYARTLYDAKRYEEAIPQFQEAARCFAANDARKERAWMLSWIGDCHFELKQNEDAAASFEESLRQFSQIEHNEDLAYVYQQWGKALYRLKRYSEAAPRFELAAAGYSQRNQPVDAAWMRSWQGDSYRELGQDEPAVTAYEQSLAVFVKEDNREGIAEDASDLGKALLRLGRNKDAVVWLAAAAKAYQEQQKTSDLAWMNFYTAKAWVNLKQDAEAIPLFEAAAAGFEKSDQLRDAANMFDWIGDGRRRMGDREGAVAAYRECIRRCDAIGFDSTLADNAYALGKELLGLEQPQAALPVLVQAAAAYSRRKQPVDEAECLILAGRAHRKLAQWKHAAEQYAAAIDLLTKNDQRLRAAEVGREIGEALIEAGQPGLARSLLLAAEKAYRALDQEEQANQIRDRLAGLKE